LRCDRALIDEPADQWVRDWMNLFKVNYIRYTTPSSRFPLLAGGTERRFPPLREGNLKAEGGNYEQRCHW